MQAPCKISRSLEVFRLRVVEVLWTAQGEFYFNHIFSESAAMEGLGEV